MWEDAFHENLERKAEISELKAENARLKAEVERLEKGIQPEGSNDAVGRAVELLLEKEKEIASLKAEVERLTNLKSGADYFKAEEGKQS
jgi:cell division protein FtsB